MKYTRLIYEVEDGIALITLNRPDKLNATDDKAWDELSACLAQAETDNKVKTLILTGTGKAFCAGDDVSGFEKLNPASTRALIGKGVGLLSKIERLEKPVIAAVNGLALGGGFEITLACDMTIASETAIFGLPEAKLGLVAAFAVFRLSQIIGVKRARRLLLTCDSIDASEAFRIGLVNRVVPPDKLLTTAKEESKKIMKIAPLAISVTKAMYNRSLGEGYLDYGIETLTLMCGTDDGREGVRAFFEKRKPVFKGT